MTVPEILGELHAHGQENIRLIHLNHGAHEPCLGVRIGDMKPIRKRIRMDYQIALDLYDTGVYDAMYLAGLVADDAKMTRNDLEKWVRHASLPIATYPVAWVASGSPAGLDAARDWIDDPDEVIAAAGWATWSCLVSVRGDEAFDLEELRGLLERVERTIHNERNDVRYQMNAFVIALGSWVASLTEAAKRAGAAIGPVTVDVGKTACRIPYAPDYIANVEARGTIGKKKKTAKC